MIEIIASNIIDIENASSQGADRIELVSALIKGGITPSLALIKEAIKKNIQVNVMLRLEKDPFIYSPDEIELLRQDALYMEDVGVKQVVVGLLTPDKKVDIEGIRKILKGTKLKATFHRAIDEAADIISAVESLEEIEEVTHILTSGGPGKAVDNLGVIRKMIEKSTKTIIVASGVSEANVSRISKELEGLKYDLHVGTAVRGGLESAHVSRQEVKSFIEKLKRG